MVSVELICIHIMHDTKHACIYLPQQRMCAAKQLSFMLCIDMLCVDMMRLMHHQVQHVTNDCD